MPVIGREIVAQHFVVTTFLARLVAERMKLMIELSAGASAYAALFKVAKIWPDLKKVGVILCGGNADMNKIPWM